MLRRVDSQCPTQRRPSDGADQTSPGCRQPTCRAASERTRHGRRSDAAERTTERDPPRADRREQPRLAQPLDDVEEHRRQEDAEERHAEHAAEDGGAQRPPHLRPGARGDHQRHHAEDEGERGHQDRPQPQPGRFQRRLERGLALARAVAWRTRRSGSRSCTPARPARPGRSARRCSRPDACSSTPTTEQSRHIGTTRITASGSDQLSYSAASARKTHTTASAKTIDRRVARPDLHEHQLGPFGLHRAAAASRRRARSMACDHLAGADSRLHAAGDRRGGRTGCSA